MKQNKEDSLYIDSVLRLVGWLIPEKRLRDSMKLYPGKTREEVKRRLCLELGRRLLISIGLTVFLCMAAASFMDEPGRHEAEILRPLPGETAKKELILIRNSERELELELEVGAMEYEESEIEELHAVVEDYLESVVPGGNRSWEKITENLNFPEQIPEMGNRVYWKTDAPWLVESDGTVHNEELTKAVQVEITAEVTYGVESRYFVRVLTVCPKVYTEEEELLRRTSKELQSLEEKTRTEDRFVVPEELNGWTLSRKAEQETATGVFLFILAAIIPLLAYFNYFSTKDSQWKRRAEEAERGYLEFITKLSFLMAAGVSVRQAFVRLAGEYEKNYGETYVLTMELKVTKQELENGYSEGEAYTEFGRRMGVSAYQRMASLLTQNTSRGVQGIRTLLLQEAKEVMAQERATIKTKGEQAGTKLLVPMMGLLFLVFAILLVPAFQSF